MYKQLIIVVLAVFLAACGGSSSKGSAPSNKSNTPSKDFTAACEALEWDTESAQRPLDPVFVRYDHKKWEALHNEITSDKAPLHVLSSDVLDEAEPVELPIFIQREETDDGLTELVFLAPLNAKDIYRGSDFELTLLAGEAECKKADRLVLADGLKSGDDNEVEELLAGLKEGLDEQSEFLLGKSLSYDELLVQKNSILANDELPADASMEQLVLLLAAESINLLEHQYSNLNEQEQEYLRAYIATTKNNEPFTPKALPFSHSDNARMPTITPRSSSSGLCNVSSNTAEIDSFERLATLLERQQRNDRILNVVDDPITTGVVGGLSVFSAISGVGLPYSAALVFTHSAMNAVAEFSANTLPSSFVFIMKDFKPERYENGIFPEDVGQETGELTGWENLRFKVKSREFNLSSGLVGMFSNFIPSGKPKELFIGKIHDALQDAMVDAFFMFLSNELDKMNETEGPSCLQIPQTTWTVTDDSAAWYEWVETDIVEGDAISLSNLYMDGQDFTLEDLGAAGIQFSLIPEKFAGYEFENTYTVNVKPQVVTWETDSKYIDTPGETIILDVWVENTDAPEKAPDITVDGNTDISRITPKGEGVFEVEIKTSSDQDEYPVKVVAEREAFVPQNAEPRKGSVYLTNERSIALSASTFCVEKGDSTTITAKKQGFSEGDELAWMVDSGATFKVIEEGAEQEKIEITIISNDAPVTVDAFLAGSDKDIAAAITFETDCTCFWDSSGTAKYPLLPSNLTTIFVDEQKRLTHIDFLPGDSSVNQHHVLGVKIDLTDNPIPLGETGEFSARIQEQWLTSNKSFDPEWSGHATVTITEHRSLEFATSTEHQNARQLGGYLNGTITKYIQDDVSGVLPVNVNVNVAWEGPYWIEVGEKHLNCSGY